uniref:CD302 molecule n=1 Tax=Salvator merianae TaxID=96440 RepID=A0A8D0EF37_SALMN
MGAPSAACSCLWSGLLLLAAALPGQADDGVCPSAWISFGSSCYALLQGASEEMQNLDDAREFCKSNASRGDIISINNKEENIFIQNSFCSHWHGPVYIPLGMFYDTDDDIFKWYDESKVNFTNWMDEKNNEEPLNTCAVMDTRSGGWKKTACEHLPLTEILCETTIPYEKKSLREKAKAWTTTLVITSTVLVSVSAAFLWFLYQRRLSTEGRSAVHSSLTHVPNSDEVVLIEEENEYIA